MEIIYTENSKGLAKSIGKELTLSTFPANVRRFNNQEISVSVAKPFYEAVVIASTVTNEDWIELFLLLDALRDTKNIILCLPYMGYSRQDKQSPNESYGAKVFSRLLETANISRCVLLDNHGTPLLRIPTIHVSASGIFETDIASRYDTKQIAIVSPDIGGASRAEAVAKALNTRLVICNKSKSVFGELTKVDVIRNVSDKICILIDDIIDSGATLCHASDALLKSGCKGVVAYSTHGVLSRGALERLEKSGIAEIVLTDSILRKDCLSAKFREVSIASLIAEAIRCIL